LINILIVAEESKLITELTAKLVCSGLDCLVACNYEQAVKKARNWNPGLILVDLDNTLKMHQVKNLQSEVGKARNPLIILLVPRVMIGDIASNSVINDFIVKPGSIDELYVRVQRLLKTFKDVDTNNTIRCGDLIIDIVGCEVRLGGRRIELTFKEYELLRILAANKGRVFSREALLNKVWKYDYIGGERTVDVHVRRLRSKIEDADHTFIETIRNIGYRFRKDS
jgi:two-component system alkaline phosphatase synthesis response regulator PhoP